MCGRHFLYSGWIRQLPVSQRINRRLNGKQEVITELMMAIWEGEKEKEERKTHVPG